jgi:DNA-binding CsgD family transcriptional regulator
MPAPQFTGAPHVEKELFELGSDFLDRAQCLLVALDREGSMLQINGHGANLLGVAPKQILGDSWFEVFLPLSHRMQCRRMYQLFMDEMGPGRSSYHYPVILRNGTRQNFLWFHTVLVDALGKRSSSILFGQIMRETWEETDSAAVHHANGPCDRTYRLSPKERQIAEKIRDGYTSKDISEELSISPLTVDRHRNNIRQKLQVPHELRLGEYLKLYL